MNAPPLAYGSPAFARARLALFCAGFATFGLLYGVQPLLPPLAQAFGIGPASASLALSATTAMLAAALLVAGAVSDAVGRKPVMQACLFASVALAGASAWMPEWWALLAVRTAMGVSLAGVPAVAMAYLGEETDPRSLGAAMGAYIGGTALGGMGGRLVAGVLADVVSWRWALTAVAAIGLLAALAFWRLLPPSRRFTARSFHPRAQAAALWAALREPALPWLYLVGFVTMGGFVAIYNYVAFRLLAPPYAVTQAWIGAISLFYLLGVVASARMGVLADRIGRRRVLALGIGLMLAGVGLTSVRPLGGVLAGMALLTFGFFGAHAIASSWVARRGGAQRTQAASLYLFAYYAGSSVLGALGGVFWAWAGWPGVAGMVTGLLGVALLAAWRLARIPPLPLPERAQASESDAAV